MKELRPMLYKQIGWSISYSKIRDFLVEQGFHIRTKSETKIGKSHPHGPNKGFTGHHHTVSSKKQISKTLALHAVNIKGEAYYRFGKLCKRGHDYNGTGKSLRLKSDGSCLECKKVLRIEKLLMKNKS